MCTLTWWHGEGSYELYFNRDERRSRSGAEPPALREAAGVRYLAPRDPEGGGTWIFVNEWGLSACLLNYYEAEGVAVPARGARSRGTLVTELAGAGDAGAALQALEAMQLGDYGPFYLAVIDPVAGMAARRWDGRVLDAVPLEEDLPLLTTSSFDTTGVVATRREQFRAITEEADDAMPGVLEQFHAWQSSDSPAYGVCMSRPDACTVSLARVRVNPDEAMMSYAPRLGEGGFDEKQHARLPLRPSLR